MKKFILFILILVFLSPGSVFAKKLIFNPTEGVEDVFSFGDTFNMSTMKEYFGEITRLDDLGVNSDGAQVKAYNFSSGFGCLTGNDIIVQMWISKGDIHMESGIKIGSELEDVTDEYGFFFITEGDPKFGTGKILFNLHPNHILSFGIDIDGKVTDIISSNCLLIYELSPSADILKRWEAPFQLQVPDENTVIEEIKVINEMSYVEGNYMVITGEIVNNTPEEVRFVEVVATHYNEFGQPVDTSYAYVDGLHIKPGIVAEFTIVSKNGQLTNNYELVVNHK